MFKKSTRRNFRKGGRKFAKKRFGKKKVSLAVKKYVSKIVKQNVEDKQNDYAVMANIGNIYSSNTLGVEPLYYFPPSQNATINGRIGNQITVKKLSVRYILWPTPFDVNLNPEPRPQEVMIYFGRLKANKMLTPDAQSFQRFYQQGTTANAPTGDLRDCISIVNSDLFTIFATRRHKVGTGSYLGDNTASSGGDPSQQYYVNNDFKYNVMGTIDLTKHMTKKQTFDDDSFPQTGVSQVYMWAQSINADGTLLTTATIKPIQFYYSVMCRYEDA